MNIIKNIIMPTIILTLVGFVCTFALSHIDKITKPYIIKQDIEKQEKALSAVLPGYTININDKISKNIDGEVFSYWTAEKKNETDNSIMKGYAFLCEKPGYSGAVKTMVGVDEAGIIIGMTILQQSETPGLGARSTEVASSMTFMEFISGKSPAQNAGDAAPWFQEQFRGIDTGKNIKILKRGDWNPAIKDELLSQNAVSAITGATITTRAVKDGIESGIQKLRKCLEEEKSVAEENR